MARQSAKALFDDKAMGDNQKEFAWKLKTKIKQNYQILCNENAKECEVVFSFAFVNSNRDNVIVSSEMSTKVLRPS